MGAFSYTSDEFRAAAEAFERACASLFDSHTMLHNHVDIEQARQACFDALLATLLDFEVIQEVMRMEGNFPLDRIDVNRLHLEALRRTRKNVILPDDRA